MMANHIPKLNRKIYEQHDRAFSQVSAFIILKEGEFVATIAFKFPRDGAGRLWAYVHFIGLRMVRGYADGYGYDKRSAAVEEAAKKIRCEDPEESNDTGPFVSSLTHIGGSSWRNRLRDEGYQIYQAV